MPKPGFAHPKAQLTDAQVILCRQLRERKGMSFRQIAEVVACSMWTVRDIVEYRTRVDAKSP